MPGSDCKSTHRFALNDVDDDVKPRVARPAKERQRACRAVGYAVQKDILPGAACAEVCVKLRERMFRIGIDPFGNVVDEAHRIDPVVLIEQKCIQIDLGVARERLERPVFWCPKGQPGRRAQYLLPDKKARMPRRIGVRPGPQRDEEAVVCVAVVKDSTPARGVKRIDYKAAVVGDAVYQRDVPQGVRHESAIAYR